MKTQDYWTITDPAKFLTSELLAKVRKYFEVWCYKEKEDELDTQFPAPKEDLIVSFNKNYEPDSEYIGKSYNETVAMFPDKKFMTIRQYLILVVYVWETENKHLDIKGWTRTSSLWSDGYLVLCIWHDAYTALYLTHGSRDYHSPHYGFREAVSLNPQPSFSTLTPSNKETPRKAVKIINKII